MTRTISQVVVTPLGKVLLKKVWNPNKNKTTYSAVFRGTTHKITKARYVKAMANNKVETNTCTTCSKRNNCQFVNDSYNKNGKCIAEA